MEMRREIERKKKVETMKQVGTMKWHWKGYSQPLAEEEEEGLKGLKRLEGLEGFLCEQSRSSSALQRMGSGLPPRLDRTLVMINMNLLIVKILIIIIFGIALNFNLKGQRYGQNLTHPTVYYSSLSVVIMTMIRNQPLQGALPIASW